MYVLKTCADVYRFGVSEGFEAPPRAMLDSELIHSLSQDPEIEAVVLGRDRKKCLQLVSYILHNIQYILRNTFWNF